MQRDEFTRADQYEHKSNPAWEQEPEFSPGFPDGLQQSQSHGSSPATSFFASDAPSYEKERRFDHFYLIHHGLPPKQWERQLRDVPWVVPKHNKRVDDYSRDKYLHLACLTTRFCDPYRRYAIQMVMGFGQDTMNKFTRHYEGCVGAFLTALLVCRACCSDHLQKPGHPTHAWYKNQVVPFAEANGIKNPDRLIEFAQEISDNWE